MIVMTAPIEAAASAPSLPQAEAPSPQAEAEVRAFLAQVYAGYARSGGHGAPLNRPQALFEPVLAAAIARDRGHTLEADPFCAGQDWTPFTPTIGPLYATPTRAQAAVRFVNGRPVALRIALVKTPAGWRIQDMSGTDLPGLRAMLLHPKPRRRGDDAID